MQQKANKTRRKKSSTTIWQWIEWRLSLKPWLAANPLGYRSLAPPTVCADGVLWYSAWNLSLEMNRGIWGSRMERCNDCGKTTTLIKISNQASSRCTVTRETSVVSAVTGGQGFSLLHIHGIAVTRCVIDVHDPALYRDISDILPFEIILSMKPGHTPDAHVKRASEVLWTYQLVIP
jgi:hypothetical protein